MMKTKLFFTLVFALNGLASIASALPNDKAIVIPDLTKGDKIPKGAKHDWNLGPTGLRGWMF